MVRSRRKWKVRNHYILSAPLERTQTQDPTAYCSLRGERVHCKQSENTRSTNKGDPAGAIRLLECTASCILAFSLENTDERPQDGAAAATKLFATSMTRTFLPAGKLIAAEQHRCKVNGMSTSTSVSCRPSKSTYCVTGYTLTRRPSRWCSPCWRTAQKPLTVCHE